MNHNNHNQTMFIWMGIVAAAIIALSLFAGWGALALLFIICPLAMFGMMLFMGNSMHHGDSNKHDH